MSWKSPSKLPLLRAEHMVPWANPSPQTTCNAISSAIYAGLTVVSKRQTDHATSVTIGCIYVCTACMQCSLIKKGKGSPYSITEHRVPELIPVLGSQPAGDASSKPSGRLPLLSARPAVTLATLNRAATNFAAW